MNKETSQFGDQLANILSTPLTPDTLTDYGNAALHNIVELVEVAKDAYCSETGNTVWMGKTLEDKIFQHFHLTQVDIVLDELSAQVDRIAKLDDVVRSATLLNSVTVPPAVDQNIEVGNGNFEEARTVDKTKTTLFLLQQEFGVDIHDSNKLTLYRGDITSKSFRKSPYYIIDAVSLSRTVLVCDEMGNKTFVFDNRRLADYGLTPLATGYLSKPELEELIQTNPGIGQSVRYSKAYASNMVSAIDDPVAKANIKKEVGYLAREVAPEHSLGLTAIAACFGITTTSIRRLLNETGNSIEPAYISQRGNLYDPWQQNKLRDMLLEKGALSPVAPEGYMSIAGLSRKHGNVSRPRIKQIIEELLETPDVSELDLPKKYKVPLSDGGGLGIPAMHYRPEFVSKVEAIMEERGLLTSPAPEGSISYTKLKKEFGRVIDTVINELGDGLGEIKIYKFGSMSAPGLLPGQVEIIKQNLPQLGLKPDGYATKKAIADEFNIDDRTLKEAITTLGEELGPMVTYKDPKTKRPWDYYSPSQKEVIKEYLTAKGLFSNVMPEGFTTVKQLASDNSVKEASIYHAVKVLKDQLGEIATFRLETSIGGGRPARALSPTQQSILLDYLRK